MCHELCNMNIVVFHHQNMKRDIGRGADGESHNYSNADMLAVQRVIFLIIGNINIRRGADELAMSYVI